MPLLVTIMTHLSKHITNFLAHNRARVLHCAMNVSHLCSGVPNDALGGGREATLASKDAGLRERV